MSTPLQPIITKAGLAAIFRADKTGISAQITHVVLGTAGYTPSNDQESLVSQTAKFPIAGGERLSPTLLHLTALADDSRSYWVKEIGFLLSDGTLLAVWSDPSTPLTYKPASSSVLLAYDVSLSALPADSVTIVSNEAGLSLSLAAPLAAQAQALIAEQLRGLLRQEQIEQQAVKQRLAGEAIAGLLLRMKDAEQNAAAVREDQLSSSLALASAVAGGQLRELQRQDQLDDLAARQGRTEARADNQGQRLKTVELRQDTDREGLLSLAICNTAAIVALQTQTMKTVYGE
ncbi:phage tail protein [Pseudomonas cremoricolorata]|uniref:phage tail-collar fiber domain-containing protein n=1 Tax=Pseudomonas cremoricolorata TaxID=157783 RepID=UPI0004082F91|nr:phage tail protein [Pseudomonas cremoricolorata]